MKAKKYETTIMGILALVIGVFVGTMLDKLFIMAIAQFMGMGQSISFFVSVKAYSIPWGYLAF